MKLAVISDIHGNVPALEAVLEDLYGWQPDQVVVNGDLINRGPYSRRVLEMVQESLPEARLLKGNHESFTLYAREHPLSQEDPKYPLRCFAQWTAAQLGDELCQQIATWEDHIDVEGLEAGASFHITHGSRLGNRDGISDRTAEADLGSKLGEPRSLFVASHVHRSMVRRFNQNLVVNTGSVGQPLDGDPRAAYGRFVFHRGQWQAQIARVSYDKVQAVRDFDESGFLAAAGPLGRLIFLEHQQNRGHVGLLMRESLAAIEAGELSLEEAVQHYLQQQGFAHG